MWLCQYFSTDNKFKIQSSDYDALGFEYNKFEQAQTNKFKYQKQERIDDFDLGIDMFKFRPSDYRIRRFWTIDPLSEQYAYNSPYALQENKFGLGIELEGAELKEFNDFFSGVSAALVDNSSLIPSNYRANRAVGKDPSIFKAGETLGDLLSIVQGGLEVVVGGGEAAVTTAGVVTAPAAAIGGGIAVHGGAVIGKAAGNLVSRTYNSEGSGKSGRGKNHLQPDNTAQGDHSTFRTDPQSGKTTNTATYKQNSRNPKTGFDETKRVDVTGGSHRNSKTGQEIKTPHVHEPKQKDPRPARPNELPRQ